MSVFNGYKDVLVRKDGETFRLEGLSPAGHAWVNKTFAYDAQFRPEHIGNVVSESLQAGLSVEVR